MSTAPQVQTTDVGEVRLVSVDLRGKLDSGELLTGTPTITEAGSSDLTLSNKSVNTTAKVIRGSTVPIGMAVTFKALGWVAGATYRIKISVATDATPPQTLVEHVTIKTET